MDIKHRLIGLTKLKDRLRDLIGRYEKDLLLYMVDEIEDKNDDEFKSQLTLMRTIEQKVLKRVINDLEKIIDNKDGKD